MSVLFRPVKWFYHEFGIASIQETGRNAYLIILARSCRMFAYGTNSLILAIFFSALNYSDHQIGAFMTLTLLGDVFLGTFLTLIADKVGRRKVLMAGSFLMVLSGAIFAFFENFWILLLAAVLGVISVTGGDFGPFRSIEESVLSQLTTPSTRSDVLAWYVTTSTLGSSIGSEASGRIVHFLQSRDGWTAVDAYHALFWVYTAMGLVNALLMLLLTEACELHGSSSTTETTYSQVPQDEQQQDTEREREHQHRTTRLDVDDVDAQGGHQQQNLISKIKYWFTTRFTEISAPTRSIMYKLWFLLSVDSLADGMVPYSLTNYYMDIKFHPAKSTLGDVQSVSYLLGSIAAVFAGPLARKIGLINTMVFTHVPSSAAVLIFPFPPRFWLTAALLFVRAGLNNMDQAPRAAFIAAVVKSEERTAVMGITGMLRTLSSMAGPSVTGILAANHRFWIAFVAAGVFRLAYDFGLYAMFVNMKLYQHEEPDGKLDHHHQRHRNRDEEEELELHSLAGSDSSSSSSTILGDDDAAEPRATRESFANTSLEVNTAPERLRSRSPRRSTAAD
ncbi:hypothetical protein HRR83_006962 [Exophiala dermatitidis]|uniref:Major facilitator superfamily (MFS) profile domain-containing protein n=3 Tax=Exophiala dermatitidis TaxID=5970 RepID=H6BKB1_EXODN|nr:uncharacterized protein HMPREF1120_00756 [Exophiala dermatitidis NIH/UT8656]KAJ4509719.1 hypothetical protein HRR75_005845 [Exophiala dermatitidis]EHY52545.1 hypothetical protein HMPREF1120_00756 [Exophiala dermatitidis NIH/UT8656]KAJ4512446.1 hypothetical protein HRR73_006001 [Exophiala dermatitidis]KAJ4512679.1 hypothetical protein HRR74_006377 [Exophiala dermatitidis]KAJ4542480.1 hypothetical protein HRR77_005681 [Exophiala dermatitidis]